MNHYAYAIACSCLMLAACAETAEPATDGDVTSDSTPLVSSKVGVCHQGDDGLIIITVSSNAVPAHLAHGDTLVAEETCGDGLDNDCDGEVDEDCGPNGDCTRHERNGKDYWFCRDHVDWFDASARCAAGGLALATVHDFDENIFLVQTAMSEGLNHGGNETGWIGGNDIATEGVWIWESAEPWSYTQWNPGEPNNVNNEDCLVLWIQNSWNDWPCSLMTGFVCESTK